MTGVHTTRSVICWGEKKYIYVSLTIEKINVHIYRLVDSSPINIEGEGILQADVMRCYMHAAAQFAKNPAKTNSLQGEYGIAGHVLSRMEKSTLNMYVHLNCSNFKLRQKKLSI